MTFRRLILFTLVISYTLVTTAVVLFVTLSANVVTATSSDIILPPTQESTSGLTATTTPDISEVIEETDETIPESLPEDEEPELISANEEPESVEVESDTSDNVGVPDVPFYSQFNDISDPSWKKIGCGIASLAMLIDHYQAPVPVDTLLQEGIDAGAYLTNAGWTYAGLIGVAQNHGLTGETVILHHLSANDAFANLEEALQEGPVMASVYYTFTPGHPIPHLVVLNGVEDGVVHYNDPAEESGGGTISVEKFKPAWKQRYISIRPID